MAKKLIKSTSISNFDEVVKDSKIGIKEIEWHGITINVKYTLSLTEMMTFVKNVVEMCFSPATGSYKPEIKAFAIRMMTIELYGNFKIPSNVEHCYDLLYNSDAFDVVLENINTTQYSEIVLSIEEKLNYLVSSNAEYITSKVNSFAEAMDTFSDSMTSMFDGMTNSDIRKMAGAVEHNAFDYDKLVQAYANNKE